ncbi:unnamed protein product [Acanthoscelides obtectus]|nr:unnamed protein product [Acanthoscelides obtectus]CAK1671343.1 RING finger and CHY zinc finger domain-containing protein 1 [Acanthoscelides obtectus]
MCLPMQLKNAHKCVENVSRSNCPVCLEDIHTSRVICHVPPCGHLLHRPCFERMLKFGLYACPICQTSLVNMERLWKYWDEEVENTPMPEEYRNCYVGILCKDCHKEGTVKFHVVGFKCNHCGSYNTCRVRGPVIRSPEENLMETMLLAMSNYTGRVGFAQFKCKMCPEHLVGTKAYNVMMIINENEAGIIASAMIVLLQQEAASMQLLS